MQTPQIVDVVVLGAGASGLMCAAVAAQRGRRVLVLEKANKVGKKILMSGGGRCNFTNYVVEPDNFLSANPHFCKAALKRYTQWDFISLVERYRIAYEERKHSQLFCKDSAKDILNMLLDECSQGNVEIRTHCTVEQIQALDSTDQGYRIHGQRDNRPFSVDCHSLVVATGALSIPTLGGSGMGYDIAAQFGLAVTERRAGLVPFMFTDATKGLCERLSGLALEVTASCGGQTFKENLLFTHRGVSGPVILQISSYWYPGDPVIINLLPNIDIAGWLHDAKQLHGKLQFKTLLAQQLGRALANELVALWWPDLATRQMAELSDKQLSAITAQLSGWVLKPSATEGYRTAEVTLGGVATDAISSKTMEVKSSPGLYFIGEVLDVSGHLGGFNFQWAWSSGYSAGLVV